MTNIFKGEHFTDKAKDAKFKPPFIVTIILFVLVFFVTALVSNIASVPIQLVLLVVDNSTVPPTLYFPDDNADWYMMWMLMLTLIPAALTIVFCRFIEKRSLESMGLKKEKFLPNYAIGLIIGFVAYSATLGITMLMGAANFEGGAFRNPLLYTLMCVGWIIQGAAEEIVCRGYFMSSLSAKLPLWAAVLISSVTFGLLHISNTGFTVLAFINITLIGIVFALVAIRFNSLIPACAFHSVWNWTQGNFYGMPVSGNPSGPSVMRFSLPEGNDLWTGGAFGIEAGLGATIVSIVLCLLLLLIPQKQKKTAK